MKDSIKSSTEFKKVYNQGKVYANKYLVMYVLKSENERNRLGISVSKKVGNSVVRHRVTRLIRESYRINKDMFNSGLDIVVIARAGSKGKCYKDISSAFMHLARLHRIIKEMEIS